MSRLLPFLTSYVQQPLPSWLQSHISKSLALLPLRQNGVRHVIDFIALSYGSHVSSSNTDIISSNGPQLSLDAIAQASKLITSVPRSMSAEAWFSKIGDQLNQMLRGDDGPEMSMVAGSIISSGILSKRTIGSPGSIGWKLFVEPHLDRILSRRPDHLVSDRNKWNEELVSMNQSINSLSRIILSYRNPAVTRRIVGPALLPFWTLCCHFRENTSIRSPQMESNSQLLLNIISKYIEFSPQVDQIDTIASNLLWTGPPDWALDDMQPKALEDLVRLIERVDLRIELLMEIISISKTNEEIISELFARVTKRTLKQSTQKITNPWTIPGENENILDDLTNGKLCNAILGRFQAQLMKNPDSMMDLIYEILKRIVSDDKNATQKQKAHHSNKATLSSLGRIVSQEQPEVSEVAESAGVEIESDNITLLALSLLQTLLTTASGRNLSGKDGFSRVEESLDYIVRPQSKSSDSVIASAKNILELIKSSRGNVNASAKRLDATRQIYTSTISDLSSQDPSTRVAALSSLNDLIAKPDGLEIIDIPATTHVLLHIAQTDAESFVFQAAINSLTELVSHTTSPHLPVRILVDAFTDVAENSAGALDGRLRVGETLSNIVERSLKPYELTQTKTPDARVTQSRREALSFIATACVDLSSRRGKRPITLQARQQAKSDISLSEAAKRAEALEAWGGEVPDMLDQPEETTRQRAEREYLESIVQGWADTGLEEDVRLRTSALSILSLLLEAHVTDVDANTLSKIVDIALSVLILERDAAKVILRRAAALVLMGLLRGIDGLLEQKRVEDAERIVGLIRSAPGGQKGSGGKWDDIERVIRWTVSEENDEIVKGHAENVVEAWETLKLKRVVAFQHEDQIRNTFGEDYQLKGLKISEPKSSPKKGFIEEIEE